MQAFNNSDELQFKHHWFTTIPTLLHLLALCFRFTHILCDVGRLGFFVGGLRDGCQGVRSSRSMEGCKKNEESTTPQREMNHVFATENEGLREEVKQWVQQATASQRQLEEAKRHLTRQLELKRVSKVAVEFESALDEQATSTQKITA
ncbi:glial fibrillary acidic protein-like [Cucumis melo var. makuwa]|uniref:Glial fibrillary acidic protein-like n=1 Tax=Cucumis melo var. makuwa TaxID=1194695 RepID=A0A5A7UJQ2_CUCMM|nr:glial fibrillary acidic protein-like [Cucumis melo var. makuwa]